MRHLLIPVLLLFTCTYLPAFAQVASFTAPDTVCTGETFSIANTSTGGVDYYWNFCSGGLSRDPHYFVMENVDTALLQPAFIDLARDGNNYYSFITGNRGRLSRYSYGNSYQTIPAGKSFHDVGGVLPAQAEGLQVVNDVNGWHVLIVGGIGTESRIVRVDFGNSLSNDPVAAENYGNLGQMDYPHDLVMMQEGGNWYGFTVNNASNTLTRFDFGSNVSGKPTAVNLGNVGNFLHPSGLCAKKEEGNWYLFVANTKGNNITRLDFGSSLTITPVAVDLGTGGAQLQGPSDLAIISECGNVTGLLVDGRSSTLKRLNFHGGITGGFTVAPVYQEYTPLFPYSITNIFREGDNLYAFVPDIASTQTTLYEFRSCANASTASSTSPDPPGISYNRAGTYNISLLMNASSPTPLTYCKTVVVVDAPVLDLGPDKVICTSAGVSLDAGPKRSSYKWSTGETTRMIVVKEPGKYNVEVSNGGCTASDEIVVTARPSPEVRVHVTNISCDRKMGKMEVNVTGGEAPYTYYLNGINKGTTNVFDNLNAGLYIVNVADNGGCEVAGPYEVKKDVNSVVEAIAQPVSPRCKGGADGRINVQVNVGRPPFEYALNDEHYQGSPTFDGLKPGDYTIHVRNATCNISLPVTIGEKADLQVAAVTADEYCDQANGSIMTTVTGGTAPYTYQWNNAAGEADLNNLRAGTYHLQVTDQEGCAATQTFTLANVFLPPVTITNNDTTINIGQSVQLHAVNASDYSWTPVTGLSCADCADPVAMPGQTTTYTVTTVSGKNCVKTDAVTIHLTFNHSLYIPTAFTPNGDGVNDVFAVRARGLATYTIRIFNRWGALVFSSGNVTQHWDGKLQDVLQPAGTYIYSVTYSYFGQEEKVLSQRGAFTLIR